MKMIRCGCQSLACYDAAGLRGTQAEWELGTVSPLELVKFRLMIRKKNGTTLSDKRCLID